MALASLRRLMLSRLPLCRYSSNRSHVALTSKTAAIFMALEGPRRFLLAQTARLQLQPC